MTAIRALAAIALLFAASQAVQAGSVHPYPDDYFVTGDGAIASASSGDDHGHGYLAPGTPLDDDFVLGPTIPGKWGPAAFGTGATVTWSLMATGVDLSFEGAGVTNTHLSAFMPAGFKAAIVAAFAAWSAVADITFIEVPDLGEPGNAAQLSGDIRIGGHVFDGAGGTLAHGFFPPVNGTSAAGDIHFDIAETWKLGFGGPGFDIFQVAAHEIGHAIGLGHTGVPASLMNPFYTEAFAGPQADDIAGAVFIYGAAPANGVPEPATAGMLLLGAMGLPFLRRRRVQTPTTAA